LSSLHAVRCDVSKFFHLARSSWDDLTIFWIQKKRSPWFPDTALWSLWVLLGLDRMFFDYRRFLLSPFPLHVSKDLAC
jgi:hypothetical protein